jgi:hypothetical protein
MNNYQLEQLENIRRAAQRLALIADEYNSAVDTCNHIVDLVETIKRNDSMKLGNEQAVREL